MGGEQTTFGCGDYLPGQGPGNFSDFDGGGMIDSGGGVDPPGGGGGGFEHEDERDRDPPDQDFELVNYWVCVQETPFTKNCKLIQQSSFLPPPPDSFATLSDCRKVCKGTTSDGDPGGPSTPNQGRYWVCQQTAPLKKECVKVILSGPPPPGYHKNKADCVKGCGGPTTGGGGPIAPPPGEEEQIKFWECIQDTPFTKKCVAKSQSIFIPLPPGAFTTIEDCQENCRGGPTTGGGGPVAPPPGPPIVEYWVCEKTLTSKKCVKKVQSSALPFPPNAYSSPEACKEHCKGGPTTGGGGPVGPPPVGGGTCTCQLDGAISWVPLSSGRGAKGTWKQKCLPGTATGDQSRLDTAIAEKLKDLQNSSPPSFKCSVTSKVGVLGAGCQDALTGLCNGNCSDIVVTIQCRQDIEGGGSGDKIGGGLVDDGGGIGGGFTLADGRDSKGAGGLDGGGGGFGGNVTQDGERGAGGGLIGFDSDDGAEGGVGRGDLAAIVGAATQAGELDLTNPALSSRILRDHPAGIEDPVVAFLTNPPPPKRIKNPTTTVEIFKDRLDSNIAYILANQINFGNWDSRRAAGVTPDTVYDSLKPEAQDLLSKITNYDNTPITKNQIFSMIGSRLLEGTVSKITFSFLRNLIKETDKNSFSIRRSTNNKINEVVALSLVDKNKFPLDPAKADGVMKNILPNWKTLASDIDKYIEVTVDGTTHKYYINDDDTFINRTSLRLNDGDYFDITRNGESVRIFAKSEKDHAYILPERTRQQAVTLLGGDAGRTLEVSASVLDNIEFDYSLSASRQNFYVLSCVLSSIETTPTLTGSFLLKNSTIPYQLLDTSTVQGLRDVNDFIKYKANHKVFILDDEDIMLDYIQATSSITLKQTDIISDSPKENKTLPLLTRQIPWYIMIYPTNRSELNIFNTKSKIIELETSGIVKRQLNCKTSIVPDLSRDQTNKFVRTMTQGLNATDVFGKRNLQARITKISPNDVVFKTGYEASGEPLAAEEFEASRKKTGVRLLKEIITELDTNYLLGLNGIGKSLTEFDVFSRLNLHQFNVLSRLENFPLIRESIRHGLVADVKVIPPINRADKKISFQKTQLVQRKEGAPEDSFLTIKGTNEGEAILPPTTTDPPMFGPVSR